MSQRPRKVDPLNELRQRKYEAGHGDAEAFKRQHAKGKPPSMGIMERKERSSSNRPRLWVP